MVQCKCYFWHQTETLFLEAYVYVFRRRKRSKILSGGAEWGGGGEGSVDGRLNNFIEAAHCLSLIMFYNVSF